MPSTLTREVLKLSRTANLEFRTYQAYAAGLALKRLKSRNLVLTLPQGTGKTFVSQLIVFQYLRRNRGTKALVIAPTKELREQYVRMAEWMGRLDPRILVLDFREPLTQVHKQVSLMVEQAHIIVATPELFNNRLSWITPRSFRSISLCVLDEVDLWLIDDFGEPEGNRYHAALLELKTRLKAQRTRFLGLTASDLSPRGHALLVGDLKCEVLIPFHRSIVKWLPRVRIEPVLCFDSAVVAEDLAISAKSSSLIGQLIAETGGELLNHDDDFWSFIKALADGKGSAVAQDLARALLNNERRRVQLFEDVPFGEAKIKKAASLAHSRRPSIIYCREIQLVNRLTSEPWQDAPAVAHSGLGDRYLQETLKFKAGDRDVLLMTRDLGKRGLDFPMACSLILVSPKSSVRVMDQELCRTRGQRKHRATKTVYVLFYGKTYEEEKMRRVLRQLIEIRMYRKFEKFTLSKSKSKWLNRRPALRLLKYVFSKSGTNLGH